MLRRHGLRPSKGLGQHFLRDGRVLQRIADTAALEPSDVVLEIGPGLGLLTVLLAERAGRVVTVELDRKMMAVLNDSLGDRPHVHLVQGDILKMDPPQVIARCLGSAEAPAYKVVANLPYYITSAALRHLLESEPPPRDMTLMVQRDVAERIIAQPGQMSLLAVSVQIYGEPRIAFRVPAAAFYPSPKVESAVLRVELRAKPLVPVAERALFFRVVQAGFGQRRKQLHNSLRSLGLAQEQVVAALATAGIDPERRAQTLSVGEWASLARAAAPYLTDA